MPNNQIKWLSLIWNLHAFGTEQVASLIPDSVRYIYYIPCSKIVFKKKSLGIKTVSKGLWYMCLKAYSHVIRLVDMIRQFQTACENWQFRRAWLTVCGRDGKLRPRHATIFVSSHMYPENPKGTRAIVGYMNMGYVSDLNSQPVLFQACTDSTRPQWRTLVDFNLKLFSSHSGCGKHFIVRSRLNGLVLEVEGRDIDKGSHISMAVRSKDPSQMSRQLFYQDDVTGTIRSVLRNYALDATGGPSSFI